MLMTFSYTGETPGLGCGDRLTDGEPEQQLKATWSSKFYFKAHNPSQEGTAPWGTAFPEGLWDER